MFFPEMLGRVARELSMEPPPADADGDHLFELDGGVRLYLRPAPGGEGCLAWSDVLPASTDPEDWREQMAKNCLHFRLARLDRTPELALTMGEGGNIVLFLVSKADCDETLRRIGGLLDEAEVMRNTVQSMAGASGRSGGLPIPDMRGFS